MTATTNTAATEAPAKRKPSRPKKVKAEAETVPVVDGAPVDFKTLAAETRAKMGARVRSRTSLIATDTAEEVALPPIGSHVLVRLHDSDGDLEAPFEAVVKSHLTEKQQSFSHIENAVLTVEDPAHGTNDVRADEVTLLETQAEVPVDTAVSAPLSITVPLVAPGTLGLLEVPISQTVRSACNVRHHYDPLAIEELADSLHAQGQQQNASGRWTADGKIEVVAGESRRRAQLLRVERGQITDAAPFLVRISEMTNAEALEISATENMRRRSMTPLEECEAMAALQDAGRTVEAITATFGYKTQQPVVDRILAARNLLAVARERLDQGRMSLAQAFVIARVPGELLQKDMVEQAGYGRSASDLARMLTDGQFLVSQAGFNVEKSGLAVVRDMFDTFEPYFQDKTKAISAQVTHAHALAEKRRALGKWAFVDVESSKNYFSPYDHKKYDGRGSKGGKGLGLVIHVNMLSGKVQEIEDVKLKVQASSGAAATPAEREMPVSAYLEAHQLRGSAAREAILGDTHLSLALTVWGLILGSNTDVGRLQVGQMSGMGVADWVPEALRERWGVLQSALLPATATNDATSVHIAQVTSGIKPDHRKLLELLVGLTDPELLWHLNTLVAPVAYNWSLYSSTESPAPEYTYIASLTGAATILARDFKLTDAWLKRYPRGDLVKLAEEAGLGRALVEDCKTLKEMRARILEHAERLHSEGFVPSLVQFPASSSLSAGEAASGITSDEDEESDEDLDEEGSEEDAESDDD